MIKIIRLLSLLFFISILPKAILSDCYNCANCDENGYCSECLPGFDFRPSANDNVCNKCNAKCKKCVDYKYFDCTQCYDGFYLQPEPNQISGQCHECKSELCTQCTLESNVYKCLQCKPGYFLDDNNNCEKCYDTCLTCKGTGSNQCLTCKENYFDSSSGQSEEHSCVSCAPLCKECHGANIADCDVCIDGYYKIDNECRRCDANCATCSSEKTHCLSCNEGFYLENNVCHQCYEHCKSCEGPNEDQCTDCYDGYVENNGYCQDCKLVTGYNCPKCKKFDGQIKCTQCPPGYKPVEDYDDDSETTDCMQCFVDDCYSCPVSLYDCERCNDHFYLAAKDSCVSCEFPCSSCIESPTKCTSCYEHYHYDINTNTCKECPENCLECDSNLVCTKCNNTYYPLNNGCSKCDESCYLCKDGTNACEECAIGYHFNEVNRCVPCPDHCDRCNLTHCLVCKVDFYPENGVCTPCADVCAHCNGPTEDDCINCDDGFYFSDYHQACFACDKSCSVCIGPSNYQCSSCSTGYFLNDINNQCSKCEFNCLKCESLRNCLQCNDGFRLYTREGENDQDCQPCKNRGCKKCDTSASQCTECFQGYYAKSTGKDNFVDCLECPHDCKSCSINQQGKLQCNDCNDGYYLNNGICTKCESPCATCSSKNQCLSCINGYLFDGVSKCSTQCSPDCLSCEQNPNKCTSCPVGYVLSGTRCMQCLDGCSACQEQMEAITCTSCIDGFYLEWDFYGQKCTKCNDECATCYDGREFGCSSCSPGYYFTQMNTDPYRPYTGKCESCSINNSHCLLCIENCNDDENFNCEPTPICTKCIDGFYVDSDNVCQPCDKTCGSCNGPSDYDCITCAEGLLKYEDKCVSCSDTCLTCDIKPDNCTSCKAGQYVKDGTCNSCNLDNCLECKDDANYCTKCPSGKYLYEAKCYSSCTEAGNGIGLNTTTNECYKCKSIDKCLEYDISCKCTSCEEGYYSYTDPITLIQICSPCKLDNCSVCTGPENNDCTQCKYGFYLHIDESTNNKECRQCKEPCLQCSGNDGLICNECDIGYQLNGTICDMMPESCKVNTHCEMNNTDGTDYVNYTTHLPSYENVNNDQSGGALRVINGGFVSKKCNFTKCVSSSGGGGGIYIYNNLPEAQSSYIISLNNLVFDSCEAQFGAAICIYSPSETSPVKIKSCIFNQNALRASGSNSKINGGSAIYLTCHKSEITDCSFYKNKGKGGACKITDDFDTLPEGLKLLNIYPSKASILISGCTFENDRNSDCSLFYSGELRSSKVVVNDCSFSGDLAKGAHYIDGKFYKTASPEILISSCRFDADEKSAFNSKLIKAGSQSQNTFAVKDQKSSKSWILLTSLVAALAVLAILTVLLVVRKFGKHNDGHSIIHESVEP